MKRVLILLLILSLGNLALGQLSMGVDVYNRYVWRGTDFGNAASVQPSLEYTLGSVTVGAWGAWSVNGSPGGNENDLYLSTTAGPISVTLTDYFFPAYAGSDDIFNMDNHILEMSAGLELGPVATTLAYNLSGDVDHSTYVELGYGPVTLGMGNGLYTVESNPDFGIVSLGVTASRDLLNVSYIVNPEQETSFLVFGFSL